jgi:hypothetical protein
MDAAFAELALLCHSNHVELGVLWRCIEDTERKLRGLARREWRGVPPAVMAEAVDPVHWILFFPCP